MGILNMTPDSFSDGGHHRTVDTAARHARKMWDEGATIVDVGGESTRPGAAPVDAEEEISRIEPLIREIAGRGIISIDTMKARVAEAALNAGAHMVNDVSGLVFDPEMAALVAERGVPVVIMHMQGRPATMQQAPRYNNVVEAVYAFFSERLDLCARVGIDASNVILDPGFGFGKSVDHNYELLWSLSRLREFGRPLLVGTSRKSMIAAVTGRPSLEREFGSAASAAIAIVAGANIIRVHRVDAAMDVARVADACRSANSG